MEIGQAAGLPSGTVHPILARLEGVGWLTSRWEDIDPRQEGRPALLAATPWGGVVTALLGSRGTGQAGQPTWWASLVVRTAALPLPSEHRWRYRQEFLSELYGMTPAEQRHHASGVLSRVVALRVALTEPEQLLAKEATMAKSWRCRLRLHRWQRLRNPQGGWYRECRNCGEQDDFMSRGPADTFGGGGRGGV